MTPDLSIVGRSTVILNGQPEPFRSHPSVSESVLRSISGLHHGAPPAVFAAAAPHLTPSLAHPSRVSHKLPVQALFPCDLAVFWPSYGSLTNRFHDRSFDASSVSRRLSAPPRAVAAHPSAFWSILGPGCLSNLLRAASVAGLVVLRSVTNPDRAVTARPSVLRRIRPRSCLHRSLFIKLWV
jgi:hypothetical protein